MNKVKTAIRVAELDALSDTLVRLFKADGSAQGDSFLAATMGDLERQSAAITTALLQDKIHSRLAEADGVRDAAVRSLNAVVAGYAAFPAAEKRAAAEPVKAVCDKYTKAGITSANYLSESSLIESFLEELAADGLAQNIAALDGVADAIAAVRTAQDAFVTANDAYTQAAANKGTSASALKRPLLALVNEKLVPYLDAMTIAGNAACADFTRRMATEIERANEVIAKRARKGTAATDDAAESPAES